MAARSTVRHVVLADGAPVWTEDGRNALHPSRHGHLTGLGGRSDATRRGRRGYFARRVRSQQVALLPERARSRAIRLHGQAFGIIRTSALIRSGDETYVMEALKRLEKTN